MASQRRSVTRGFLTPENCSACGAACPGQALSNCDASCVSASCLLTCRGENYDVDGSPSNGCEQVDSPTGNHTQGTAASQGSHTCNNTDTFSFNGVVLNDTRTHTNPAVTGFNSSTGSAPDWHSMSATGGPFCTDDLSVTLSTSGGTTTVCYRLNVMTNAGSFFCSTTGTGTCTITQGSGAYSDNTTIFFVVERTCTAPTPQCVTYTVSGHL